DFHVTGVQTCALPIWSGSNAASMARGCWKRYPAALSISAARPQPALREKAGLVCGLHARGCFLGGQQLRWQRFGDDAEVADADRSEERRVGKECIALG